MTCREGRKSGFLPRDARVLGWLRAAWSAAGPRQRVKLPSIGAQRQTHGFNNGMAAASDRIGFGPSLQLAQLCRRGSATSSMTSSRRSRPFQVSRRRCPAMCRGMPAEASKAEPTGWSAARNATASRREPSPASKRAAHVCVADHLGEFHPMGRKGEARLRDCPGRKARRVRSAP